MPSARHLIERKLVKHSFLFLFFLITRSKNLITVYLYSLLPTEFFFLLFLFFLIINIHLHLLEFELKFKKILMEVKRNLITFINVHKVYSL